MKAGSYQKNCDNKINLMFQESESLISQKIHPQTIITGWRKATDEARRALQSFARDNGQVKHVFMQTLNAMIFYTACMQHTYQECMLTGGRPQTRPDGLFRALSVVALYVILYIVGRQHIYPGCKSHPLPCITDRSTCYEFS